MDKHKKKWNKILSIFLLTALILSSLSGCSGNIQNDTESSISSEYENDTNSEITSETQSESDKNSESDFPDNSEDTSVEDPTTETETENDSENITNNNTGNNDVPNDSNNNHSGNTNSGNSGSLDTPGISLSEIPAYTTQKYIVLNNGIPHFATNNLSTKSYEYYSPLDSLGRCGVAYACLGRDLMPTDERGSISSIKPTGWHTTNYKSVPGNSLYNRSHLIAWSLAGENANKLNLISGTQHLNQREMTKFEDMVRDYIKETGNHVMYRVTPFFEGNNLIATGVQMEAWSVEDNGEDICFNVFIYNVQDGIYIDYATGESYEINPPEPDNNTGSDSSDSSGSATSGYAVNGNNGKIHIVGACTATEEGHKSAMKNPIYFDTYEEALAYVQANFPDQNKPQCGNCWKLNKRAALHYLS